MGVLLLPTTKSNLGHGIKPANTVCLYSYIACYIYEKLNKLCDSATEYKTTKMKLDSAMRDAPIEDFLFVRTLVWCHKMSS
jgi:predicted metal-binding transcription factor (methanogenesis marker protein 9)